MEEGWTRVGASRRSSRARPLNARCPNPCAHPPPTARPQGGVSPLRSQKHCNPKPRQHPGVQKASQPCGGRVFRKPKHPPISPRNSPATVACGDGGWHVVGGRWSPTTRETGFATPGTVPYCISATWRKIPGLTSGDAPGDSIIFPLPPPSINPLHPPVSDRPRTASRFSFFILFGIWLVERHTHSNRILGIMLAARLEKSSRPTGATDRGFREALTNMESNPGNSNSTSTSLNRSESEFRTLMQFTFTFTKPT